VASIRDCLAEALTTTTTQTQWPTISAASCLAARCGPLPNAELAEGHLLIHKHGGGRWAH
jgi:hypothetical protein